jgi:glycosyltransferase family protein
MDQITIIFIKLVFFFLILYSIIFPNKYKKYYFFFLCYLKCIHYYHKLNFKCLSSPREIIFNGLNIFSPEETLDEIIRNNRSISRFGDGEFNLMLGQKIGFQEVNNILITKLNEVLKSNEKGLLIGIFLPYNDDYLKPYINVTKEYLINWIESRKFELFGLIDLNRKYYSSFITRFYIDSKDKSKVPDYIKKLKQIWENKDILIIEGEKSRLGIGNDLFNNSKSIKRILCPAENAFNVYDKIIDEAKKIDKSNLILLALGPTSTVLAYDLYKLGYHAIDIGHIDIEYEWFLRNATERIPIANKYVNEISGNKYNFGNFNDTKYYKEIISIITN